MSKQILYLGKNQRSEKPKFTSLIKGEMHPGSGSTSKLKVQWMNWGTLTRISILSIMSTVSWNWRLSQFSHLPLFCVDQSFDFWSRASGLNCCHTLVLGHKSGNYLLCKWIPKAFNNVLQCNEYFTYLKGSTAFFKVIWSCIQTTCLIHLNITDDKTHREKKK